MNKITIFFTSYLCSMIGLIIWHFLIRYKDSYFKNEKNIFLLIFVIGFICRILFVYQTPLFYAPDEIAHFNYIKYISENNSLPVQTSLKDSPSNDWEYYQPPLYYFISSYVFSFAKNIFNKNQYCELILLRFQSLIFWIIFYISSLLIIKNLKIKDDFLKVFCVSTISLLPTFVYTSSMVNNDNLLICLGGIYFFLSLQKEKFIYTLIKGIVLGFLLITKLSGVIFIFFAISLTFSKLIDKRISLFQFFEILSVQLLIALLVWIPWLTFNHKVYGSLFPFDVANVKVIWSSTFYGIFITIKNILETFWSVSGIYNDISFLTYFGVVLTFFAFIGLLKKSKNYLFKNIPYFKTFILVSLFIFILALRFGYLYNEGQGRFLFPMLIPLSLVIGAGIKNLNESFKINSIHLHISGFLTTYSLGFTGFSIIIFSYQL